MVTEYENPIECMFHEQDEVLIDLYQKMGWSTDLSDDDAFDKLDSWLFDQDITTDDTSFISIRVGLLLGRRLKANGYGQFRYTKIDGHGCICIENSRDKYDLIRLTYDYFNDHSKGIRIQGLYEKIKQLCKST